jgi:hypothetical protein
MKHLDVWVLCMLAGCIIQLILQLDFSWCPGSVMFDDLVNLCMRDARYPVPAAWYLLG